MHFVTSKAFLFARSRFAVEILKNYVKTLANNMKGIDAEHSFRAATYQRMSVVWSDLSILQCHCKVLLNHKTRVFFHAYRGDLIGFIPNSNSRNDKVYVWRHLRKVFSCFCVNARNNVWAYEAQIFSHARLVLVFHWILNDNEIQLLRVNFPRTSDGRGIKCFREYGIRIKCRSTSFRKPHYNFNHFSFDPPHRTHQLIWSQISKMASKSQKSILVHGNSVIRVTTQNSM